MLRAFQTGPVARQFGKLVGTAKSRGTEAGVRVLNEPWDAVEDGCEDGRDHDVEGFSATDRLLGAVRESYGSSHYRMYLLPSS